MPITWDIQEEKKSPIVWDENPNISWDDDQESPGYDFFGGLKAIGISPIRVPGNVVSSALRAIRGGDESIEESTIDRMIKSVDEKNKYYREKFGSEKNFLPGITVDDIVSLPENIGYTGVSAVTGLAAAAPFIFLPEPTLTSKMAAWGVGTATTGSIAYRMAKDQFVSDLYEMLNAQSIKENRKGLNQKDWDAIRDNYESKAVKYGLWEAIPEALGQAATLGIIRTDPSKLISSPALKKIFSSSIARIGAKFAASQLEEQLTETITQKGQAGIEAEVGLREEAPTWKQAFQEQFGQTFLLTSVMGLSGGVGSKVYDYVKNRLKNHEISTDDFLNIVKNSIEKKEISVEDLMRMKEDPDIKNLNIDDEINKIIIDEQSKTLSPRPVGEIEKIEEITPVPEEKPEDQRFRTEEKANNFRDWVNLTGGLNLNDPDFKGTFQDMRFDITGQGKKKPRRGFPKGIWRSAGMSMDQRTEQAIKAGWLPEGSTEDDFIDLLESNPTKDQKYSNIVAQGVDFEVQQAEEDYYKSKESFLNEYTEDELRKAEAEAEAIEQNNLQAEIERNSLTKEELTEIFRPIEPPASLKDITVKVPAIREATGESVLIEQDAQSALDFNDNQSEVLYNIRACLEL